MSGTQWIGPPWAFHTRQLLCTLASMNPAYLRAYHAIRGEWASGSDAEICEPELLEQLRRAPHRGAASLISQVLLRDDLEAIAPSSKRLPGLMRSTRIIALVEAAENRHSLPVTQRFLDRVDRYESRLHHQGPFSTEPRMDAYGAVLGSLQRIGYRGALFPDMYDLLACAQRYPHYIDVIGPYGMNALHLLEFSGVDRDVLVERLGGAESVLLQGLETLEPSSDPDVARYMRGLLAKVAHHTPMRQETAEVVSRLIGEPGAAAYGPAQLDNDTQEMRGP